MKLLIILIVGIQYLVIENLEGENMTVYFIYKHGESFEPFLYAITDKKKLKDSFVKERNKHMFVVKEKELTKDEFTIICSNHGKYILGRRGFETQSHSPNLQSKSVIYITTTFQEEMDVIEKDDTIFLSLGKFTDECAKYFNKKLLAALNTMYYFEIYKFVNEVYCYHDYFVRGVDTFTTENYKIDMFGVFLYLYGDSLDKEGLLKDN